MRSKIITLPFLSIICLLLVNFNLSATTDKMDGHAVIQISNYSQDMEMGIRDRFNKTEDMSLEYSCLESGFIVIKISNSQLQSAGDFQMKIKQELSKAGIKDISVLKVRVTESSTETKC
jgi:type IV pilus biogenesis protein CpaD/CtpE